MTDFEKVQAVFIEIGLGFELYTKPDLLDKCIVLNEDCKKVDSSYGAEAHFVFNQEEKFIEVSVSEC